MVKMYLLFLAGVAFGFFFAYAAHWAEKKICEYLEKN
jgi:hypothetical protein